MECIEYLKKYNNRESKCHGTFFIKRTAHKTIHSSLLVKWSVVIMFK